MYFIKPPKPRAANEIDLVFLPPDFWKTPGKRWPVERRKFILPYEPYNNGRNVITWENGERWQFVIHRPDLAGTKPRRFHTMPPDLIWVYPNATHRGIDITVDFEMDALQKMEGYKACVQSCPVPGTPVESHCCVMDKLPPAGPAAAAKPKKQKKVRKYDVEAAAAAKRIIPQKNHFRVFEIYDGLSTRSKTRRYQLTADRCNAENLGIRKIQAHNIRNLVDNRKP